MGALRFSEVSVTFESGRRVLAGLSAELSTRELTFVAGASGAGKSVLCRLAVGLLRPEAGRVSCWASGR